MPRPRTKSYFNRRVPTDPQGVSSYWNATREPLYCLVFLLPLVAAYEFGALFLRPGPQLVAQQLIEGFVAWFGPGGFWIPGFALLMTLLIWHILSKRSWQIRAETPLLMAVESLILTLPLFIMKNLVFLGAEQTGGLLAAGDGELKRQIVLAMGAGLYEELLFRLYLISLLLFLLIDLSRVPAQAAFTIAVVVSGLVFAICHIQPVGGEVFDVRLFILRALAGSYLSLLFVARGLGVSAGAHAAYDVLLQVLPNA